MKVGKSLHNMDVWWVVRDSMWGSTEDMGDSVGGELAACAFKVFCVSPTGLDCIC